MQDFEVKKTAIEIHVFIFSNIYVGVSLNGGTPISHPKMIIFSRKNHGCWGKPIILGNHHIMGFPTTNSTYHERFSPSSSPTFFWVFQLAEGLENLNDFPYAIFVVRTKKTTEEIGRILKISENALKRFWRFTLFLLPKQKCFVWFQSFFSVLSCHIIFLEENNNWLFFPPERNW